MSIVNNDNIYCQWTQLFYGQGSEPTLFVADFIGPGFFMAYDPGAANVPVGSTQPFTAYLTAQANMLNPPFNYTHNITVIVFDANNRTGHFASGSIQVTVDPS